MDSSGRRKPKVLPCYTAYMIIFVGGLPGTGKTSLSKAVAQQLGIFHVDVDEVKKRIYPTDPDFERNIQEGLHFSDATRTRVMEDVAKSFHALHAKHKHIMVEEVLQKKILRDILYKGAMETFGTYLVIHVTADEKTVHDRLTRPREGHMLTKPWNVYQSIKKDFDGIPEADIVFHNDVPFQEATEQLTELLKQRL